MNIEPIITDDGSPSFRNIFYDQPYHSKSGAIEEAFQKYAVPLKIWEKKNPVIYDVCFGIGYNAAAAIDLFIEKGTGKLTVYCFENDEEILGKILQINPGFRNFSIIKNAIKNYFDDGKTEYAECDVHLILCIGDAKKMIKDTGQNADFVFFDPFSPKKHPEMWEEPFFRDIYEKTNENGILSTYSYARIVRDNLKSAGFEVTAGPIVGRRSPSTIAFKRKEK